MLFSNQTTNVVAEILKFAELVRPMECKAFCIVGVADLEG